MAGYDDAGDAGLLWKYSERKWTIEEWKTRNFLRFWLGVWYTKR
jgi:hypothetical protein